MNIVQDPDIVDLYTEIRNNPNYLEVPNEMPFVESLLHTAASRGRTGLALEILRLKPSLGKKLNFDGLSPLHLALDNGHTNTVRRLVKHDPELIRVPGREGITLLHYAVEKGEIDLMIYFLLVCPLSIFDVTVRDETAAYIAVRNRNFRALMVLLGWATKTNRTMVFCWRNEEGNTLIHLAALTNQPKVMKSLIKFVDVNKKNLVGRTALDILNPEDIRNPENDEARKFLISSGAKAGSSLVDDATRSEKYLMSDTMMRDFCIKFGAYLEFGLSGNMRNAILVVLVLIATAAFQAILTPPSGISHNDTTPVFPSVTNVYNDATSTNSTSNNFNKTPRIAKVSMICNTIAFGLAMGTCVILTMDPLQLFLWLSVALFSAGYTALAFGIYPGTEATFIPIAIGLLFILPSLIILPWKTILFKGLIRGENYYEYNLDEVKYLIFVSTFVIQGPVLTMMAQMKASQ